MRNLSSSIARVSFLTQFKISMTTPSREEAWELLCEYTKGDSLRNHAIAVETAMRACAKHYGEADAAVNEWGLVGLLYDFDYEMFASTDPHPFNGSNTL